jgi:hypothetical protein
MLKSTYSKAPAAQEKSEQASEPELPPGWSAHVAPKGKKLAYCEIMCRS